VLSGDVDAVCLLTGHVLKDTEAIVNYHLGDGSEGRSGANRPIRVAADLSALEQALANALHG
jgi:hypothetical protein